MSFKNIFLFVFLGASVSSFAQTNGSDQRSASKILWLTLEEAQAKSEESSRKIMLFMYTDWCVWCKKMEETTFVNEEIADYINRNYYPVKFDAEAEQAISFNSKTYNFQDEKPRGVHELAFELMGGRVTYPTIAFLDETWKIIQSIPNYQSEIKFEQIITYFGEDFYRITPWSSYQESYTPLNMREDE